MTRPFVRTSILLALVLFAAGCKKKQKTTPAAQAPTLTAPATNTSAPTTETKSVTSAPVPDKPPSSTETAKPKSKPKPIVKKTPPQKPATEPAKAGEVPGIAKAAPPRIIVQPAASSPSETATTVVPDMSHTEEAHHRQTTEQLMQSTEANLKSLKRVLNTDERAIYQQIQLFMAQSKEATLSQDLVRAHNLALKAHLLSDELTR